MGRSAHPDTAALLITADAGGSNGPRVRLWKWELQQFANRTGLAIMRRWISTARAGATPRTAR